MTAFFVRGVIIGFSIAAPVGPIGVLCMRRTLAQGRASGFVSGLGAVTADAIYGCVAGFGLTFLWWLGLSSVGGLLRTRSDARVLRWVNRACGVIIAGFGLVALLSVA